MLADSMNAFPAAYRLCRPGVLPVGQNSPQKCKYDLYNEGVSQLGFLTAFHD